MELERRNASHMRAYFHPHCYIAWVYTRYIDKKPTNFVKFWEKHRIIGEMWANFNHLDGNGGGSYYGFQNANLFVDYNFKEKKIVCI